MTRGPPSRYALRSLAIAIALAAAIDPAITSTRISKPEIAIVPVDPTRDSALADRVAHTLEKTFTVIPARFAAASATILVGDRLPPVTGDVVAPVFAVVPERDGPTVTFDAVRAPAWTPLEARVPITVIAWVSGARGRALDITLRAGDLVVDRLTRVAATDDERIAASLAFLPTAAGAARLRITAAVTGGRDSATTDFVVDVRDTRWAVLFFDPRPSWMSTFTRRAIERDRRFVVASRIITSRNVSTDAGQPPDRLDDLAGVARFDAIIVGAPEALSENDVAGLDTFLRRRGGSVVLLLDQHAAGPYERLTEVASWLNRSTSQSVPIARVTTESAPGGGTSITERIAADSSNGLRASELSWPSSLPAGAEPMARTVPTPGDSATSRPMVWSSPVGAGRLVVCGALDAWRFRDRPLSAFDRFWQTVIAEAANAAPPPVAVRVSNGILSPGEWTDMTVTMRDPSLSTLSSQRPIRAGVSGAVGSPQDSAPRTNVRLWPDGAVGRFRGSFRAPMDPGIYRVVASGDGSTGEAPIVVAKSVSHPTPPAQELLSAWVGARGGRVISASQIGRLPAELKRTLRPTPRTETWYPMHSPWWILPFALALSGEWWLRRRRGLS